MTALGKWCYIVLPCLTFLSISLSDCVEQERAHLVVQLVLVCNISESVNCICRDGTDTPISLNKCNCSELQNADIISLFGNTTKYVSAGLSTPE